MQKILLLTAHKKIFAVSFALLIIPATELMDVNPNILVLLTTLIFCRD
jgi:hypothetical protein